MSQQEQISSYSSTPKYRIGAVSRLTGLSADVVRVWERRYGAIRPQRSDGGSRLYSDADIARLRRLRQAVEMGHAIGQVAKLPESELDTLSSRNREAYSTIDETGDPYKQTISRFLEAVSRMDVVSADDEISRAATLYPPRVIVKSIVIPVLTEIGDRWAHRDFGIAQEHIATNLIRNLLSSLFRLYPPDASAETIVLATTSGERHEFGILTSALIAATRGWRVVYLGTELPANKIVRTARIVKARVLAISLVTQNPQAYEEMKTIAENMPSQTRVWVGGAEALKHRDWFERVDWILVRDLEDLDDRLKR
ncbi:MAG: MerR family transcriptional regulator [Acidobacteria bacterium]|nr:MerR family transcriptional regulator [Acidobacteriota bacterium]